MTKSVWCPDRYIIAYRFAARAHQGQTMPGSDGLPYIVHVSMVAMEVMTALTVESVTSPDLAVQCALLHDVVEDSATTQADILTHFGPQVAAGVAALSKDPALPGDRRMADSLRRIRQQPAEVWMVKLADRITNLQPPPDRWSRNKRQRYYNEAHDIAQALGQASPHLCARMSEKLLAYREYIVAG